MCHADQSSQDYNAQLREELTSKLVDQAVVVATGEAQLARDKKRRDELERRLIQLDEIERREI